MVVGDDDQSIYRFRGATIANILGLTGISGCRGCRGATYRSAGNILGAANAIISNNRTAGKELDRQAGWRAYFGV